MLTPTLKITSARELLLGGKLDEGLDIIEAASSEGDDMAAFLLAQVLAFKGEWPRVRNLSLRLLKHPFTFAPYLGGQDLMQLLALSAIYMGDWGEAKKGIESVRSYLESMMDMYVEVNPYAEAFNRIEAFIWAEGKGRKPFTMISPINYASMTKDEYARLTSLALRAQCTTGSAALLSFEQLDNNRKHSYYLWKALYDEALEEALQLYLQNDKELFVPMAATLHLAQLLLEHGRDEEAWQILKPEVLERRPDHRNQIVWLELLWNTKTRPLMTAERCLDLLTSAKVGDNNEEATPTKQLKDCIEVNYLCRLARCLNAKSVKEIESLIAVNPDDLQLRLKLIGAYGHLNPESLANKKAHISWLIAKYPDSQLIEELLPYLFLDKETMEEDFEQFKQDWLEAIEKDPDNTAILFNASLLLGADDKALAEELLTRAQILTPDNIKIAERLYELNAYQVSMTKGQQKILHAQEALRQAETIKSLDQSSNSEKFSPLRYVARRAWFNFEAGDFETCRRECDDLDNLAQDQGFTAPYKFLVAVLRGRLALHDDANEKAVQYMMSTLKMEPFAHFRQDDPLLTLMAALGAKGFLGPVMEFWTLYCQQVGADASQRLEQFFSDMEEGKAPWVPAVRL